MDERLKQRLVGAAVIGAALVIFVPLLLHDDGAEAPPVTEPLPEWPDDSRFQSRIVPLDEDTAERLATPPPPVVPEPEPVPAEPESPPPAVEEPAPPPEPDPEPPQPEPRATADEATGPKAWSVQLGSFADHDNAIALRDKLRSQGFTAFERTVTVNDRKMTRVYVGPELLRSNAEAILKKLEQAVDLKGRVVRHPHG